MCHARNIRQFVQFTNFIRRQKKVEVVQFQAEHNYNQRSREAVYSFFRRQLLGVDGEEKVAEREVEVELLQDMLVWQGRGLPANAVTQAQLFEQWKKEGRTWVAALDAGARRDLMLDVFHAEWPREVNSDRDKGEIVLGR